MTHDVVFFSMSRLSDWKAGIVNRAGFVFDHLRRSPNVRKVLYVDVLPHTTKSAARVWLNDVVRSNVKGRTVRATPTWRLTEIESQKVYHLATVETMVSGEDRAIATVQSIIDQLQFEAIILWSYLPTFVQAFTALPVQLSVFDTVDDWVEHPAYVGMRNQLMKNYQIIGRNADLIFTVNPTLLEKYPHHSHAMCIPNGVDLARFSVVTKRPDLEATMSGPRLCYVGTIQERVDVDLLLTIATERPQYQLILAGPVWRGVSLEPLQGLPNVHLLGRIPNSDVPALLSSVQVGIVPHHRSPLVASMDPMKIYEYVAAGLPVVTTHGVQAEGLDAYVHVVDDPRAFIAALDQVIAHPPDPLDVRATIRTYSWENRFATMWSAMTSVPSRSQENTVH